MPALRLSSVLTVLVFAGWCRGDDSSRPQPLPAGSGSVEVQLDKTRLEAFTYKPAGYDPKAGTLLLVFHGVNRNADEYRDFAKPLGDALQALVAAPRFPTDTFPTARYQNGGLLAGREVRPEEEWTWSLVPKLADEVRR